MTDKEEPKREEKHGFIKGKTERYTLHWRKKDEPKWIIRISISELMDKCYKYRWTDERFIKLCLDCDDSNICRRRLNESDNR